MERDKCVSILPQGGSLEKPFSSRKTAENKEDCFKLDFLEKIIPLPVLSRSKLKEVKEACC